MKPPLTSSMIAEACDDLKRELIAEFRDKKNYCNVLGGRIAFSADHPPNVTIELSVFPKLEKLLSEQQK